ncbi:MAG: phosphotransferase [Candidatus Moranbacteria bacterium]|nr:phosphotransferase [Candidatus Moranbacteria bacterium]
MSIEFADRLNNVNFETEEIELEIINLLESLRNGGERIGRGRTADIYISEKNPQICYKIIERRHVFYNFVEIEKKFLEKAREIDVRVPVPIFSYRKGEYEVLAMERIGGFSVEDVLFNEIELPENFNIEFFFRELQKMTDTLHRNRIYHRDLHEGNVIIEKNGYPCVIDFGSAKNAFSEEDSKRSEFYNPETKKREEVVFATTDESNVLEIKLSLKKYIKKQSLTKKNK